MKRVIVLVVAVLSMLVTGCGGSDPAPRAEPFVGQWESTGGEAIAMTVQAPVADEYAVRIEGGGVDLSLSAKQSGEGLYKATPDTGSVWTFRMVDEELLTATAEVGDRAPVSTSFKRVGG
jgi:hypothetical protein